MSVAAMPIDTALSAVDSACNEVQLKNVIEKLHEESTERRRLETKLYDLSGNHELFKADKVKEAAELVAENLRLRAEIEKCNDKLNGLTILENAKHASELQATQASIDAQAKIDAAKADTVAEKAKLMLVIKQLNAVNESLLASTRETEKNQGQWETTALETQAKATALQSELAEAGLYFKEMNDKRDKQEGRLTTTVGDQTKRIAVLEDMLQMSDGKIERLSAMVEMFSKQIPRDNSPDSADPNADRSTTNAQEPSAGPGTGGPDTDDVGLKTSSQEEASSTSPQKSNSSPKKSSTPWSFEMKLLKERAELITEARSSQAELVNQKAIFGDTLYENATLKATVHDLEKLLLQYVEQFGSIGSESNEELSRSRRALVDTYFSADLWKKVFGKMAKAQDVVAFVTTLVTQKKERVTRISYVPNTDEDSNEEPEGVDDGPIELNEVEVIRSRFADFVATMQLAPAAPPLQVNPVELVDPVEPDNTPLADRSIVSDTAENGATERSAEVAPQPAKRQLDFTPAFAACKDIMTQMQDTASTAIRKRADTRAQEKKEKAEAKRAKAEAKRAKAEEKKASMEKAKAAERKARANEKAKAKALRQQLEADKAEMAKAAAAKGETDDFLLLAKNQTAAAPRSNPLAVPAPKKTAGVTVTSVSAKALKKRHVDAGPVVASVFADLQVVSGSENTENDLFASNATQKVVAREMAYKATESSDSSSTTVAVLPRSSRKSKTVKAVPEWRRKVDAENAKKKKQYEEAHHNWIARKKSMKTPRASSKTAAAGKRKSSIPVQPHRELNRSEGEVMRSTPQDEEPVYEPDSFFTTTGVSRGGMNQTKADITAV